MLAKAPVPGRVKTRLCPPLTPEQAAEVAEAALLDTLDGVRAADVARRVLVLQGEFLASGVDVLHQRGGGLDERMCAAYEDAFATSALPMLLVGMDTPQLTPDLLEDAAAQLLRPDVDVVLGDAADGGWWCMGLRRPRAQLLLGVPTSRPDTAVLQRARLADLRVADLPVLQDVDTVQDALRVAAVSRDRFANCVRRVTEAACTISPTRPVRLPA